MSRGEAPGAVRELAGELLEPQGRMTPVISFPCRAPRLRRQFGPGRWRKRKGIATVRLASGRERRVEVHWYEAHGIGRVKMKIKRLLDGWARCEEGSGFFSAYATRDAVTSSCESSTSSYLTVRPRKDGYVRVVDESGEDYLYPDKCFVELELPREVERALANGSR